MRIELDNVDKTSVVKKIEIPKISIITICYNEKNVEKTCQSIVNQTWQDFEWIVIDGGSEKWCLDILNKYKNHMTHFVSEKDNGIYNAMNKGILLAKGEYLNFMNAGDYFYDNRVLKKVIKYNAFDNFDIIYGNLKFENGKISKYPTTIPAGWLKKYCLPHQSSFIRKDMFEKYGLYNENYKIVSDLEKWMQFVDVYGCSYQHINQTISMCNSNGISSKMSDLHRLERLSILKKYYDANIDPAVEVDDTNALLSKIKIYLFNFIYLLKIKIKRKETKFYLFGFILLLTIKNKE